MNSFLITAESAIFTLGAVCRKGKKDVKVTWEFITDDEMVKLYQAIYQTFYGLAMFCYGVGVLTRRAMDRLIAESLKETKPTPKEPKIAVKTQSKVFRQKVENSLLSHQIYLKREELILQKRAELEAIAHQLGLPTRTPNRKRRLNKLELINAIIEAIKGQSSQV